MKCGKKHLRFIPLKNGDHKAIDTWCGHKMNNKIWFCSKECKKIYEESKDNNGSTTTRV